MEKSKVGCDKIRTIRCDKKFIECEKLNIAIGLESVKLPSRNKFSMVVPEFWWSQAFFGSELTVSEEVVTV